MEVFDHKLEEGYYAFKRGNIEIQYKIEKITIGYKVSGKIRGKLGRIKILEIQRPKGDLYLNNWQSWGLFTEEDEYREVLDTYRKRRIGIYTYTPIPDVFKREVISDYFLLGEEFLLGFLTSKIGHPYFVIGKNTIEAYIEYFDTQFEDYIPIEPLVILKDLSKNMLLLQYGDLVKIKNKVRINSWNPVGWSSWYQYFLDLKWEDIEKNLKLSKEKEMPYEVFQIDDGYEKDIGDWLSTKDGFPEMPEIATTIKHHGYLPGVWSAPLSISETSELYNKHRNWTVEENNTPKKAYYNWEKEIYTLDITNDNVKNWLYELFSNLKKIGFRYFKIDFMFAGALPGERKRNITPIQAYREALSIIRDGVGDSFVLGCGAPLLPSLGFVDGMRIGPDTAPYWQNTPTQPDINAYWALKNALTRWFMHKKWWLNDPDCLLLRKNNTGLSPSQINLYGIVSGMLDNMIFQSDDLSYIKDDELKLLNEILTMREGRPKVNFIAKNLFEVYTEGSRKGNKRFYVNLGEKSAIYSKREIPPTSYLEAEKDVEWIRLKKRVIKREDGRIFTYYEGNN